MLIRWTKQNVKRGTRDPYKSQTGVRKTLWILFIPIFSSTEWIGHR